MIVASVIIQVTMSSTAQLIAHIPIISCALERKIEGRRERKKKGRERKRGGFSFFGIHKPQKFLIHQRYFSKLSVVLVCDFSPDV